MAERRITPSKIAEVIRGGPPKNLDQEASKAGIKAHQEIKKRIVSGDLPKPLRGLRGVETRFEVEDEIEIGPDGLKLSVRSDAITPRAVIEFKPPPLRGNHLLQTTIGCMVRGTRDGRNVNGVIYLYQDGGSADGSTIVIPDGAKDLWPEITEIARGADRILALQEQIEEERANPKRGEKTVRQVATRNRGDILAFDCEIAGIGRAGAAHRKSLGYEIVNERRTFDRQVAGVLKELGRRVKRK